MSYTLTVGIIGFDIFYSIVRNNTKRYIDNMCTYEYNKFI